MTIASPDEIDYGDDGEIRARKRIGRRTVADVHDELGDTRRVITVPLI